MHVNVGNVQMMNNDQEGQVGSGIAEREMLKKSKLNSGRTRSLTTGCHLRGYDNLLKIEK